MILLFIITVLFMSFVIFCLVMDLVESERPKVTVPKKPALLNAQSMPEVDIFPMQPKYDLSHDELKGEQMILVVEPCKAGELLDLMYKSTGDKNIDWLHLQFTINNNRYDRNKVVTGINFTTQRFIEKNAE